MLILLKGLVGQQAFEQMSKTSEEGILKNYRSWHQLLSIVVLLQQKPSVISLEYQNLWPQKDTPDIFPCFSDQKNLQPKNRGICGKLIVATGEAQLSQLHALEMKAVRAVGNVKVRQNRKGSKNCMKSWGDFNKFFLFGKITFFLGGQEFFTKIPRKFEKSSEKSTI